MQRGIGAADMDIDQQGWLRERTEACVASAAHSSLEASSRQPRRQPRNPPPEQLVGDTLYNRLGLHVLQGPAVFNVTHH